MRLTTRNKIILISSVTALVIIELVIIFLLGNQIINKRDNLATIVAPIDIERETITSLRWAATYFILEPVQNTVRDVLWAGIPATYTTNSDTLNERFEYTVDKPGDTFRIINLGDSWTFGIGVDTQYNYSEVLEDLLNDKLQCKNFKKFEVINLGVRAYDIAYSVERFLERGQKYDPDLIIWILKFDDFFPIDVVASALSHINKTPSAPYEFRDLRSDTSLSLEFENFLKESGEKEKFIQYEMNALDLFNTYYKKNLLFLETQMTKDEGVLLENFIQSRDNTYVYNQAPLPEDKQIPNDDHPNKSGHLAIANGLFQYIVDNNIIPCDLY